MGSRVREKDEVAGAEEEPATGAIRIDPCLTLGRHQDVDRPVVWEPDTAIPIGLRAAPRDQGRTHRRDELVEHICTS
jgi:hypothetical protein